MAFGSDAAKQAADRDYAIAQGLAVIPIFGVLTHGAAWGWQNETSYSSIRRSLADAVANPEARGIALHVNSPGGDVAGLFDLVDAIYAMRGPKPIWAVLDETAYSAAYALASAANVVCIPRTGGCGSIGVMALHTDISGALDKTGIAVTEITYGARKTDGSPIRPLGDGAFKRIQANVDELGELFVSTVARNRKMSRDRVRATEAGTFMGRDAVSAGLADRVLSPDEAVLTMLAALPQPSGAAAKAMAMRACR